MRNTGAVLVRLLKVMGLALLCAATSWADQTWVGPAGSSNDWNVGSNWSGLTVPSNTIASIVNGGTAVIGSAVPQVSSIYAGSSLAALSAAGGVLQTNGAILATGDKYPLLVGYNTTTNVGFYDLSGGTLTVTGGVFVGSSEAAVQSFGTGLLTVRGNGMLDYSGSEFFVAHYGRTGVVVVADTGRLTLRASTMRLGEGGAVNVGSLSVSGGTVSALGLETALAGGSASVSVSGGSLWLNVLTAGNGAADIRFSGGALGAQTGNAVWSAPLTLTNGTVTFYTGDQNGTPRVNTASGVLSGNGTLVITNAPGQTAPGTLALGANNTFSGGLTLQGNNTLQLGAGGAAGWLSGSVTIADGGNLAFARSDVVTNSLVFSGTPSSIIQNGNGTLVLTNASPAFSTAVANAGLLRFSTPAAIPGTGASVTIDNGGAVAADGAYGTVTDWLNSGRLAVSSAGALALKEDNSETIDMTTAGGGLYANLALGAAGNLTYTGLLVPLNGTYHLGGGGGTLTYASPLTSGSVVIGGGLGTVVLAANNTFVGGVTVNSGTLRVGHPNGFGSGRVTVSGGVLQVNTNLQAVGGILVTNTGLVQVGPGGTVDGIISNNVQNAGAGNSAGLVFNGSGTFTHASDVTGTGSVAVVGGGTLRLNTPGQTIRQNWVFAGNNGSAGNIELSAGTLNVGDWLVVARGASLGTPQSAFTFSGGTVNKSGAGYTLIGDLNGSIGRMVLSNTAVFNAAGGNVVVSTGNGTGTLNVCGGTLNQTANDFIVANGNGSGTVNLYGGVVSNSAGSVFIGYGVGGKGTLAMTNGVLYSKNNLTLGQIAGASGFLNLTNGNVTAGTLLVGQSGTGTVTQTGGTLSRIAGNEWRIGDAAGSVGAYTLLGGTLDSGAANFIVGGTGRGTLLQAGGTLNSAGWPDVGRYPGGVGIYTLAGGVFNQTAAANGFIVGEQGTGTFIVTNTGVANLSGSYGLVIGHSAGTGTVTLAAGGLISTPICQKLAGTSRATFAFDGGTLLSRANGTAITNFMQGLTEVYVRAGGAVIDSSNNTVTVAQNLMSGASPDGGLIKLGAGSLILSGTNSYNGATAVSNGVLRLGVANAITNTGAVRVAGGIYDLGGFCVTNGAVTLSAGSIINGSLNAASYAGTDAGTLAVGLTGSGGLTKSGSGTLTLTAAQTYSGSTLVAGGVLKLFPVPSDAVIHYDFNSNTVSGTTVANLGTGGAAYNGVINGSPVTGASGKFGQAITITGNGQGVVTANSVSLTNAFTFATWVKSNGSYAQYQRIINNSYSTGGYLGTDNANKFLTIIKNKDFTLSSPPQSSADTAAWHHVALVWNGLSVVLYYDGLAIQTKTYTGTDASLGSKIGFCNNVTPNNEYWNGSMDEAYVFGRALSAGEVTVLYTSSSTNLLPSATSLQLANGATVDLGTCAQTVASVSGSGIVSNGTLTVTGVIAPGGSNTVGTLTLAVSPALLGTLLADVAAATNDLLQVQGGVDVSHLALEVVNAGLMSKTKDYAIVACSPGMLTGSFTSVTGLPGAWRVRYNRAAGKVELAYPRGTLLSID